MPSWNIHLAHAEKLLREYSLSELGIQNTDAFLVGNAIPDTYVGFLIKDTTKHINYNETHLARRAYIPLPDAARFWKYYIATGTASDVTLGAWAHLLCDRVYNYHARCFFKEIHARPGEELRKAKQGDFALYGRTFALTSNISITQELIQACAAFPQYTVEEADVRATVALLNKTVRDNNEQIITGTPNYTLLTPQFFEEAFLDAHKQLEEGLLTYAQ